VPKSRWFISPSGAMGWVDPSVGSGRDFAVFCGLGRVEILQFFLWVRLGRDFSVILVGWVGLGPL